MTRGLSFWREQLRGPKATRLCLHPYPRILTIPYALLVSSSARITHSEAREIDSFLLITYFVQSPPTN